MNSSSFFSRASRNFLAALGVSSVSGGLEVTDNVIRLAWFDGKTWQMSAVRLEPGILDKGKITDRDRLVASLRALRAVVPGLGGPSSKRKMDVTLALGESAVYSQAFSLPLVEGKGLLEAITLNMQMASPVEVSQSYSGWEIVGRDERASRIDVLGVFADRATVDEMIWALFETGFVPSAVESKELALARTFRNEAEGIDLHAPYLLVNIDDASLDFIVLRNGRLYFAYVTPWRDLEDERGGISLERFTQALTANLRQVMNFYLQHWLDKPVGVVITGQALADETIQIAQDVLGLPTFPLALHADAATVVSPEWLVAVGAAIRSSSSSSGLKISGGTGSAATALMASSDEVTLLGEGARETFQKDKLVRFAEFWRFAMPVLLGILIALFAVTDLFLGKQQGIATPAASSATGPTSAEEQQITALQSTASAFNRSVSLIASVEQADQPKYPVIADLMQLASSSDITIAQFSFSGFANPVSLAGQAQSEQQILDFKDAIEADPQFGPVTLPLSGIAAIGSEYSFTMTFGVKAVASSQ